MWNEGFFGRAVGNVNRFIGRQAFLFQRDQGIAGHVLALAVRPHERVKYGQLQPAYVQLAIGASGETTDVGAAERKAGNRQALTLNIGDLQVLPVRHVVARPHRRVALPAAERSTGKQERPFFGP